MSWGRVEHGWEGHAQLVEGSGARPGARRALWLCSFWGQAPVGSRAWGGDGRQEGLSVISKEAGRSQQRLGCPTGRSRSSSESSGPRGGGRGTVRTENRAASGDRDVSHGGLRLDLTASVFAAGQGRGAGPEGHGGQACPEGASTCREARPLQAGLGALLGLPSRPRLWWQHTQEEERADRSQVRRSRLRSSECGR